MPETWTIRRLLSWSRDYLDSKAVPSPRLEAELLLCQALRLRRLDLYLDIDRPLSATELAGYRELLKRRASGEPLAYIQGRREFYGREFRVSPAVLIPRPETELLVELAVKLAAPDALVVELGVGSGCVIVSVLAERPDLKGLGGDLSRPALEVAQANAFDHAVAARLQLFQCDLLAALPAGLELIVMNPPYIDPAVELEVGVREHEPHLALFASEAGMATIERLLVQAEALLKPGGHLLMEVGFDQRSKVESLLDLNSGLRVIEWHKDIAGHDRAVVLEKNRG
jgi:release factor glutamine methyltransferase